MTADSDGVGHDDAIAESAVMPDMAISHEHVVIADNGCFTLTRGTMDCNVLTDDVAIPYPQVGALIAILAILGPPTEYCAGAYATVCTDICPRLHNDMWSDYRAIADSDIRTDYAESADFYTCP
jgi:hypothetical protein